MIRIRPLSRQERERAFAKRVSAYDIAPYLDVVREMEGDVAYALPVTDISGRALKVRVNRAAKALGLKLHWARVAKDAKELIVELAAA